MSCREIRERLLAGAAPAGPEVEAHTRECEACRALLAGGAPLARELATAAPVPGVDLERLFRSVGQEIAAERGARAWLRSRPTWIRRLLIASAILPLLLLNLAVNGPRADLAYHPVARFVATLAALVGVALWSVWVGSRPLHEPRPAKTTVSLGVFLGVLVAFAIAALPVAHAVDPRTLPGAHVPSSLRCYLAGLVIGLPVLVTALLVRRHESFGGAVLFAVAAGLLSNGVLEIGCAATDRAHLLLGHAPIVLTYAVVVAVVVALGHARTRV